MCKIDFAKRSFFKILILNLHISKKSCTFALEIRFYHEKVR